MRGMTGAHVTWAALAVLLSLALPAAAADTGAERVPPSAIPSPVIVVVDLQAAHRDAVAARAVRAQRDQMMQKYQAEFELGRKSLKDAENALLREKSILSAEAWHQKARVFEQEAAEFQRRNQSTLQAVDKSYRAAITEFTQWFYQITGEVAGEYGATLVLPKQQVLMHDPRMELTSVVIERLNKRVPSIAFPPPVIDEPVSVSATSSVKSGKK